MTIGVQMQLEILGLLKVKKIVVFFFDKAEWEKVKQQSDENIKKWIDEQLFGTSVTVVLIGQDSANRKWINYEIKTSHERGNGLLGIYINEIKNQEGLTSSRGENPLSFFTFKKNNQIIIYPTYDWFKHDGYNNLGKWIEEAAKKANR